MLLSTIEGQDGVFESGSRTILDNQVDSLLALTYCGFESRDIVLILNLFKWRQIEWSIELLFQQWIHGTRATRQKSSRCH